MTLKDALKARKAAMKNAVDDKFWEVQLDVEVVERVHVIEYVKASSKLEAQAIAREQFERLTPAIIHDIAPRDWSKKNRYDLQHLRIGKIGKRKKFTLSELQRKILRALIDGKYLARSYTQWALVDPKTKDKWGYHESETVSSICIEALFRKGLLIDLATANMCATEVKMQTALGSLPKLSRYTINKSTVSTLGLRL